jgi:DNA-binding ferritin-like protein
MYRDSREVRSWSAWHCSSVKLSARQSLVNHNVRRVAERQVQIGATSTAEMQSTARLTSGNEPAGIVFVLDTSASRSPATEIE